MVGACVVGVLALAVPPLTTAAVVAGLPAWALLGGLIAVVRAGASLPFASVQLGAPWDAIGAVCALTGVMLGPRAWRLARRGR